MKKKLSLLLVLFMLVSIFIPKLAYAETQYTIKIQGSGKSHTYEIYQIFSGDYSETKGVLSNIEWGSGVNSTGQQALGDAKEKASSILTETNARDFAREVSKYLQNPVQTVTVTTSSSVKVSAGYYLIKDKDASVTANGEAYTAYILKVVNDVEITPKTGAPQLILKEKEKNDSTGYESDWQDAADYDFEDDIEYELTATLGDHYSEYDCYNLVFHLTLDKGLTFDESNIEILINDKKIDNEKLKNYKIENDNNGNVKINLGDIKDAGFIEYLKTQLSTTITDGSTIKVHFNAKLNKENAVLGSDGNSVIAYLEYTNDPNVSGAACSTKTGTTVTDTVIAFTYKLIIKKVDDKGEELLGATFKLSKVGQNSQTTEVIGKTLDNGYEFEFTGLDAGNYILEEVEEPTGYTKIDPITFTISATYDTENDSPELKELKFTNATLSKATSDVTKGELQFEVINEIGVFLPETGGIGIIIFVASGFVLMSGTSYLIYKSKKNKN